MGLSPIIHLTQKARNEDPFSEGENVILFLCGNCPLMDFYLNIINDEKLNEQKRIAEGLQSDCGDDIIINKNDIKYFITLIKKKCNKGIRKYKNSKDFPDSAIIGKKMRKKCLKELKKIKDLISKGKETITITIG